MRKIITLFTSLFIGFVTFAQAPEKMSYQAIIRDAANEIVANQVVGIKITIFEDGDLANPGPTIAYSETQTLTTNDNGLVTLEIGTGTIITGIFADINWTAPSYFIQIGTDPTGGSTYNTLTGTSQLMSVPFALHAKRAGNGLPSGGTDGQVLAINSRGVAVWTDPVLGSIFYRDIDSDGFGSIHYPIVAITMSAGYVNNNSDCNDADGSINPTTVWYADIDGDGFGDVNTSETGCTSTLVNATQNNTDCNDNDATMNPNTIWYLDADGDNYAVSTIAQCDNPGVGYTTIVLPLTDCDDGDAAINPVALEIIGDGKDNDCDGIIDTVPDAPVIGTATGGDTEATVTFIAPVSNGGTTITSYTAISSPGGNTGTLVQAGDGVITVTGLTNGTSYTFTITATNAAGIGNSSEASNLVIPVGVPDAPVIGIATAGDTEATITYTAPVRNGGSIITSYRATSIPGGIMGTLGQEGSGTITVTGLTNGTTYTFEVTATNAVGTSYPSAASNSIVTLVIPPPVIPDPINPLPNPIDPLPNPNLLASARETLEKTEDISGVLNMDTDSCGSDSGDVIVYLACIGDALGDFASGLDQIATDLPSGIQNVAKIVQDARASIDMARTRAASRLANATTDAERQSIRRDALNESVVALATAVTEIRKAISLLIADDPELVAVQRATITTIASALDNVGLQMRRAIGL